MTYGEQLPSQFEVLDRLYELAEEHPDRYSEWMPDNVFNLVGAQDFIDHYRMPWPGGKLDIAATAARLNIPVVWDEDMSNDGEIRGLHPDKCNEPILIRLPKDGKEPEISFAHELGHYLLSLAIPEAPLGGPQIETFCEYFARQMALPDWRLLEIGPVDKDVITQLMQEHSLTLETTLTWLMEGALLPSQLLVDATISDKPSEYDKKAGRNIVCLACDYEVCTGKKIENPEATLPHYDFTGLEWSKYSSPSFHIRPFKPTG